MITRICLLLSCCCLLAVWPVQAEELDSPIKVAQYLENVAVTIRAGPYSGSGNFIVTKDGTAWVLTAGHVIEVLRYEREQLDDKGNKRTAVEFHDAQVLLFLREDGSTVGETKLDAEVIRYSSIDNGHDLALLRLRTKKFKPLSSTVFWREKIIPPIGTDLYHCGSLLGPFGSNSLTAGIISQHGRIIDGKIYDQVTCTAFRGSSGGIVSTKQDGRYVGMVVRGAGEGFVLIVPIRRIHDWAKKVGVDFILDPAANVPSNDRLKSQPVEDSVQFGGTPMPRLSYANRVKNMQLLIHTNAAETPYPVQSFRQLPWRIDQ